VEIKFLYLWRALALSFIFIAGSLCLRWASVEFIQKPKVRGLIQSRIKQGETIKLRSLSFLRGDYLVSLKSSGFKARNFTVNTLSGDIIPWEEAPLYRHKKKVLTK
jgi:hypothetical protein